MQDAPEASATWADAALANCTIDFKEMFKFATDFGVTPSLVSRNKLMTVLRALRSHCTLGLTLLFVYACVCLCLSQLFRATIVSNMVADDTIALTFDNFLECVGRVAVFSYRKYAHAWQRVEALCHHIRTRRPKHRATAPQSAHGRQEVRSLFSRKLKVF